MHPIVRSFLTNVPELESYSLYGVNNKLFQACTYTDNVLFPAGIIGEEFPGGETTNALASQLAADHSLRFAGRLTVVPIAQDRGCSPRHPGLDVFQHDVLDAIRTLRCPLEL